MRNALVMFRPFPRLIERLFSFRRELFVVDRCICYGQRDWIEHSLQQADYCGELHGRKKVNQFVCLSLLITAIMAHKNLSERQNRSNDQAITRTP